MLSAAIIFWGGAMALMAIVLGASINYKNTVDRFKRKSYLKKTGYSFHTEDQNGDRRS